MQCAAFFFRGRRSMRRMILSVLAACLSVGAAFGQTWTLGDHKKAINRLGFVSTKVMVPMRDGVRLATDIYLPKDRTGPVPTIFWKTPYDFNNLKSTTRARFIHAALERGYAFVIQNERGKFFSEGTWEILGHPRTDGYDGLSWIAGQDWSDGQVGTMGCSSSAEWQLALAAQDHPNHTAMVPMASGAGIGRVGGYFEQGNWYRGGAEQLLFASWLFYHQNTHRLVLPEGLSDEDRRRVATFSDLTIDYGDFDALAAFSHLPLVDYIQNIGGQPGTFDDLIRRTPNHPDWYKGGLVHDSEPWGVPAFWWNSWYDVSQGPNLALARHAAQNGTDADVQNGQYTLIAPTLHCGFYRIPEGEDLVVGERNMGDAWFDVDDKVFGWFDYWMKGKANGFLERQPKVEYYAMGANAWRSATAWPPEEAQPLTLYLTSDEGANSLFGDGALVAEPGADGRDRFTYDPMNPVPSVGGQVCCNGVSASGGSRDQRGVEARADVLVYTSAPLTEDLMIAGQITATLYVSSDARDTDFTVKLVDVAPDGTAYNLVDTIQRARWREGYAGAPVFMDNGEVYEITLPVMDTANVFKAGHRIRVDISSSNFPIFSRNLNTGGDNITETEGVVARNTIHHGGSHASRIVLQVVR